MLVTGADVLESFTKPGVWLEDQVREILGAHGVVCISRFAPLSETYCNVHPNNANQTFLCLPTCLYNQECSAEQCKVDVIVASSMHSKSAELGTTQHWKTPIFC